jgi:hypothetical protein
MRGGHRSSLAERANRSGMKPALILDVERRLTTQSPAVDTSPPSLVFWPQYVQWVPLVLPPQTCGVAAARRNDKVVGVWRRDKSRAAKKR